MLVVEVMVSDAPNAPEARKIVSNAMPGNLNELSRRVANEESIRRERREDSRADALRDVVFAPERSEKLHVVLLGESATVAGLRR